MIKQLFSTVFYWFMWVVVKNTHVIAEFCEWIRKRSIRLVWRVSFHTQRSQRLGSVALVCIRREWPSSHSLTFPNALHVLIMIRGKGQRIPACLAAAAHRLLAMYSGRRALVTGVCQPEENRQWFTAVFACEDNKRGLRVNTSDLFWDSNWQRERRLASGCLVLHIPAQALTETITYMLLTSRKQQSYTRSKTCNIRSNAHFLSLPWISYEDAI